MAHGHNKYLSRENRARVRQLFFREWDPIGVSCWPDCSDEYHSYADEAYVMLMDRNAGSAQLASYLFDKATGDMGLTGTVGLKEKCRLVAERLVALRPEFTAH